MLEFFNYVYNDLRVVEGKLLSLFDEFFELGVYFLVFISMIYIVLLIKELEKIDVLRVVMFNVVFNVSDDEVFN